MSEAQAQPAPARKPSILLIGGASASPMNTAAMILRGAGYSVVNPVDFRGAAHIEEDQALRRVVRLMLEVDRVVTLPNYEDVTLSARAASVARELSVEVVTYKQVMKDIMGE